MLAQFCGALYKTLIPTDSKGFLNHIYSIGCAENAGPENAGYEED